MLTQHREGKFPPKYENEKMASFGKARDELVKAYDEGTIEDNDFVLLWEQNISKNSCFPYDDYETFSLETIDPVKRRAECSFFKGKWGGFSSAAVIKGVTQRSSPQKAALLKPHFFPL